MEPKTIALPKSILFQFEIGIYAIAFAVTFLVSGPQWLTGTLVNYLLFMYISAFPKKNIVTIAVLPSIAAVGHGVLFGPATPFLLYFLPFIWIGNLGLMKLFAFLLGKTSFSTAVLVSSIVKVVILFVAASVYFQAGIVPKLFLSSMGIIQFFTAVSGGMLSLISLKLMKKYA